MDDLYLKLDECIDAIKYYVTLPTSGARQQIDKAIQSTILEMMICRSANSCFYSKSGIFKGVSWRVDGEKDKYGNTRLMVECSDKDLEDEYAQRLLPIN